MRLRNSVLQSVVFALSVAASAASAQTIYRVSLADGTDEPGLPGFMDTGSHANASISDDGQVVAFINDFTRMAPNGGAALWDAYARNRVDKSTTRCMVDSNGFPTGFGSYAFGCAISGNGRYVAFWSDASDLVSHDSVPPLTPAWDVYRHDLVTGKTIRVSKNFSGGDADADSFGVAINFDGDYIAFSSEARNLVNGLTDPFLGISDVFRYRAVTDETGVTELVSRTASGLFPFPDGHSGTGPSGFGVWGLAISADGRFVAFPSEATNLAGAGNPGGKVQVFRRDMNSLSITPVSRTAAGAWPADHCGLANMSADANFVAFASSATDIVIPDVGSFNDGFVRDISGGTTERVNENVLGNQGQLTSGPFVADDGQWTLWGTAAANMVAGDTNGVADVFLRKRASGGNPPIVKRVTTADGNQSDGAVTAQDLSGTEGNFHAVVDSQANNLVAIDSDTFVDTFVHDTSESPWKGIPPGLAGSFPYPPTFSATGSLVVDTPLRFSVSHGRPLRDIYLVIGFSQLDAPFKGGTMIPNPFQTNFMGQTNGNGNFDITLNTPSMPSGFQIWHQFWLVDELGPAGFASTGCMKAKVP